MQGFGVSRTFSPLQTFALLLLCLEHPLLGEFLLVLKGTLLRKAQSSPRLGWEIHCATSPPSALLTLLSVHRTAGSGRFIASVLHSVPLQSQAQWLPKELALSNLLNAFGI